MTHDHNTIPADIRFESGLSDPDRDWCISVQQPQASLIADGALSVFCKGEPPPRAFIGRRIFIHAGGAHLPYNKISDEQRRAVQMRLGKTLEASRRDLPVSQVMASAEIVAAFVIGRAGNGVMYASPREKDITRNLGDWEKYRVYYDLFVGEFPPGKWAWILKDMRAETPRPLKGFGGLFDLEHGFAVREKQGVKP